MRIKRKQQRAIAAVQLTLDAIDFNAMFRRVRDNLNIKAGYTKWT